MTRAGVRGVVGTMVSQKEAYMQECEIVLYGVTAEQTRDPEFRRAFHARHPLRVVHWDTARDLEANWRVSNYWRGR